MRSIKFLPYFCEVMREAVGQYTVKGIFLNNGKFQSKSENDFKPKASVFSSRIVE